MSSDFVMINIPTGWQRRYQYMLNVDADSTLESDSCLVSQIWPGGGLGGWAVGQDSGWVLDSRILIKWLWDTQRPPAFNI